MWFLSSTMNMTEEKLIGYSRLSRYIPFARRTLHMSDHNGPEGRSMVFVLPGDVLRIIVSEVLAPGVIQHENRPVDQVKRTQDMRLVCQCFNELASRFLLPVLEVELSEASLDRAREISSSPHIRSGIRSLRISSSHYPKFLADDFWSFAYFQLFSLEAMEEAGQGITWRRAPMPLDLKESMQISRMILNMRGDRSPKAGLPFKGLRQSYDVFKERHAEQIAMAQDGSFIQKLKAIVSRIPRINSLEIIKDGERRAIKLAKRFMCEEYEHTKLCQDETLLTLVRAFLVRPINWDEFELWKRRERHVDPVLTSHTRVLLDIPSAL